MIEKMVYGIVTKADMGSCPSCHNIMLLPVGMNLDTLQHCPVCGADSMGFKWCADKGKSAHTRIERFRHNMEELDAEKRKAEI